MDPFETPACRCPDLLVRSGAIDVALPGPDDPQARRLLVAGDWAPVRQFASAHHTAPEQLYTDLLPAIANANLAVVNLECPLGGDRPLAKDGPNFRCDPDVADALASAGFHLATLANNHIYDQQSPGLAATLDACSRAGLATVGAGGDLSSAFQPALVDLDGLTVGILAFADREEGMAAVDAPGAAPADDIHLLDRCRHARARCDFLLVIAHGGKEYAPVPPTYWYRRLLAVAQAGADAVVAHHPHVPQGLTLAARPDAPDVPVVFSTGNFLFPPRDPTDIASAWMKVGYLVELAAAPGRTCALTLTPYLIDAPTPLRALPQQALEDFRRFIETLSRPLTNPPEVADWFDAAVDYFWTRHWRERLEGLTPAMCRDDVDALRHGRSHFRSPAHLTLIDRAIERKLAGTFGRGCGDKPDLLAGWFAGTWPVTLPRME